MDAYKYLFNPRSFGASFDKDKQLAFASVDFVYKEDNTKKTQERVIRTINKRLYQIHPSLVVLNFTFSVKAMHLIISFSEDYPLSINHYKTCINTLCCVLGAQQRVEEKE